MNPALRFRFLSVLFVIATAGPGCEDDLQMDQNSSWTIERASRLPTYKVVAYGDSIFAGLVTVEPSDPEFLKIARRAAPYVAGEYLSRKWDANIKVVRRTTSGAMAGEVYADQIVAESARMQTSDTRVVMFEMCGSNYLQARKHLREQTGTCNYQELYGHSPCAPDTWRMPCGTSVAMPTPASRRRSS